jgi:hypothetical protein
VEFFTADIVKKALALKSFSINGETVQISEKKGPITRRAGRQLNKQHHDKSQKFSSGDKK